MWYSNSARNKPMDLASGSAADFFSRLRVVGQGLVSMPLMVRLGLFLGPRCMARTFSL